MRLLGPVEIERQAGPVEDGPILAPHGRHAMLVIDTVLEILCDGRHDADDALLRGLDARDLESLLVPDVLGAVMQVDEVVGHRRPVERPGAGRMTGGAGEQGSPSRPPDWCTRRGRGASVNPLGTSHASLRSDDATDYPR